MERILEPLFEPLKILMNTVYDVLMDAAQKVWRLAKPVAMIGLLIDLLTAKLGWIHTIIGYYNEFMRATSGTSWLVLLLVTVLILSFMHGGKK